MGQVFDMVVTFTKDVPGFHMAGGRTREGDQVAECSCGWNYQPFQDRAAMMAGVRSHAREHVIKLVTS